MKQTQNKKTAPNVERYINWLAQTAGMDHFAEYREREEMKHHYGQTVQAYQAGQATFEELFEAAEGSLKAWFFRSVQATPFPHPSFPVYASMALNEEFPLRCFGKAIYDCLAKKYTVRKGRFDGSYWVKP